MFFPPIPLIRKKIIIKKLTKNNAISEENAKTFAEAGIINPNGFKKVTEKMIEQQILIKTKEGMDVSAISLFERYSGLLI